MLAAWERTIRANSPTLSGRLSNFDLPIVRMLSQISRKVAATVEVRFCFFLLLITRMLRQSRCCRIVLLGSTAHLGKSWLWDRLATIPKGEGKGTTTFVSVLAPSFCTQGLHSLPWSQLCVLCGLHFSSSSIGKSVSRIILRCETPRKCDKYRYYTTCACDTSVLHSCKADSHSFTEASELRLCCERARQHCKSLPKEHACSQDFLWNTRELGITQDHCFRKCSRGREAVSV